jgi:small subunit ribosomal protein S16
MVVRIRLSRFGTRNSPNYRITVADSRFPRDGRFLEHVGTYNPVANPDGMKEISLSEERIKYWLAVGAQPTKTVCYLLAKVCSFQHDILRGFTPTEIVRYLL